MVSTDFTYFNNHCVKKPRHVHYTLLNKVKSIDKKKGFLFTDLENFTYSTNHYLLNLKILNITEHLFLVY